MRGVTLAALLLASVALAACSGDDRDAESAAAAGCVPTIANGNAPPGEAGSDRHHGNGKLWTVLWPNGIVRPDPSWVRPDGSIQVKFPWWRGVEGPLTISGRRADRGIGRASATIPHGYGTIGFQASTIRFPAPGCWSITGRVGATKLTFVVELAAATASSP
jgi:hypothetical protein